MTHKPTKEQVPPGFSSPGDPPDNLRIWNALCDVPKEFTRPFKTDGDDSQTLTAISPWYLIKRATELWGPIGDGWNFDVIHDEIIRDGKDEPILHIMRVSLHFHHDSLITGGVGCTPMKYRGADGKDHWDDDFNKKTLTDAITNALARLGAGGDIRMSQFEDNKYLDHKVRNEGGQEGDPKLDAAWEKVIAHMRKTYPDEFKEVTDVDIMARCAKKLADANRRVTAETVLSLID
jgi:hypothetical protein